MQAGDADAIELDLYESAALGDGGPIATAVVSLVLRGVIRPGGRENELVVSGPLPDGCHPVEEAVYRVAAAGEWAMRVHPDSAIAVPAESVSARLRALGLYPGRVRKAVGFGFVIVGIGLAFTLFFLMTTRWEQPAMMPGGNPLKDSRSQGAGFCCMLASVAQGFAGLVFGTRLATLRTRRGQTLLARLRRQHPLPGTADLPLAVALFGVGPLETAGHADLTTFLYPPPVSDPNPTIM